MTKAALVAIVGDARAQLGVAIATLKKPEAAHYVRKAVAGIGWLPAPRGSRRLRTPLEPVIRGYAGAEQGSAPVFRAATDHRRPARWAFASNAEPSGKAT